MKPAVVNLTIYQGSTFMQEFQWKTGNPAVPVDLTGYTARMQIRPKVTDPTIIATLTTENGGIVFPDAVAGKFMLEISAAATALMEFKNAVYDLEMIMPNGKIKRLFGGTVTLSFEVTR